MAISPILLNGSIQQTDNVLHNQLRQMEKGMVDQGNIQVQEEKRDQQLAKQVVHADETLFKEERFDAKEKDTTVILAMVESAEKRQKGMEKWLKNPREDLISRYSHSSLGDRLHIEKVERFGIR